MRGRGGNERQSGCCDTLRQRVAGVGTGSGTRMWKLEMEGHGSVLEQEGVEIQRLAQ